MFETILFPVDFSKRSEAAAHSVASFARLFHSKVILLHLVETPDFLFGMPEYSVVSFAQVRDEQMAERRRKLDEWSAPELEGIPVQRILAEGDPAHEIVRYAHENAVSLIMMPSHGFGPFRRFVIGSTTAKVLHDAHVPVWTDAHAEQTATHSGDTTVKNVACAINLGPNAESAIKMATRLVAQTGGEAMLVHAIPSIEVRPASYFDVDFSAHLSADARVRLDELQSQLGTHHQICIEGGDPAEVVSHAAVAHKADLVVIARGAILGGLGRLRTHAYSIINKSPVPVLSV